MASKIFTGDMPELMGIILKNLNDDTYSLYSCALVSRHWCKISIPIIWQDPFEYVEHKHCIPNTSYIPKYFSSLDEDEKIILRSHGINVEFSKTLFDYARFLKVLSLFHLKSNVKTWIESHLSSKPYHGPLICHISNLLLKLFIESGATLHTLNIDFDEAREIRPEIFKSLERNDQFLSRIQDLTLYLGEISEINTKLAITLLKVFAKNSTKLCALQLEDIYPNYDPQVFHTIVCIIKSQKQLREFTVSSGEFPNEFHGIISALESQKRSLREIIVDGCDYSAEFKVLMNCENLEVLRIKYCNYRKLLKKLDYKVSTLELVNCAIDAMPLILFFESSGRLLQRLKLEASDGLIREQSLLLEALKSFCPNITYLNLSDIEFSTQLLDLISNLQRLQFLTLSYSWSFDEISDEKRVMLFARILPLSLQYLDIRKYCLNSYIDILLKDCYAPLKKLLINSIDKKKIAKAIIKFCKRKGSLNYVGISDYWDWELDDNFMEVDEYVTVVPYYDIVVNC